MLLWDNWPVPRVDDRGILFPAAQESKVNDARAGFLLTRHWRDTPNGTEIVLWLATDSGPQRVVLPPQ